MTRAVLLSYLGVGLLGGLLGGGVVRVTTPSAKPPRIVASAEPETDSKAADERIAQLEKAVATLERERKMTRLAVAYGSAMGAAEDAGAPPSSVVDDPCFKRPCAT